MSEQEITAAELEQFALRYGGPTVCANVRRAARTIRRLEGEVAELRARPGTPAPSGRRYRMKDGVFECDFFGSGWRQMKKSDEMLFADLDVVERVRKGVARG